MTSYPQPTHDQQSYQVSSSYPPPSHNSMMSYLQPTHGQQPHQVSPSSYPSPPHDSVTDHPQPTGQQPYQAQPQMTVGWGGNRNPANKPLDANGQREWTYGLCDSSAECGACLISGCCPCMMHQSIKSRREALEKGAPHPRVGMYSGSDCLLFAFFSYIWCVPSLQTSERTAIRNRYNIEGDGCGDCMTVWCCLTCALTQESREIEGEEKSFAYYQEA